MVFLLRSVDHGIKNELSVKDLDFKLKLSVCHAIAHGIPQEHRLIGTGIR